MIKGSYDAETVQLLTSVFNEAWATTQKILGPTPLTTELLRASMATRIMMAADKGERNPQRLKLVALQAIEA